MRRARFVFITLLLAATLPSATMANSASPTLTNIPPVPKSIANACGDLQPTLAAVRVVIENTSQVANDAGMNALGLGTFSRTMHYRVVEDDFANATKQIEPALDATSDLQVAIDDMPDGDQKTTAAEVAKSYDTSLRNIKDYTQAALVFERAAWARVNAKARMWGWGGYANNRNLSDKEQSADQARTVLDSQADEVKDAERSLKLPEHHWSRMCGTSLYDDTTRRQASEPTPGASSTPSPAPSPTTKP